MSNIFINLLIIYINTLSIVIHIFKVLYEKNNKVKGVAFHWYTGSFYEEMDLIQENYPDILQIETEMCYGFSRYKPKKWVIDAEYYLTEIINGMHHALNVVQNKSKHSQKINIRIGNELIKDKINGHSVITYVF